MIRRRVHSNQSLRTLIAKGSLNDVAGFIGPEVFRTKEQLVRCCLEDIVMGKLHGLLIGLDVCSTLHMDVSLDELGWCIDQIMAANPGYLMALPTRIDPMLGYLTTGYQDHVHIREAFGFKVNDRMWQFFQELGVIDATGKPTEHFGDPAWVYLQFWKELDGVFVSTVPNVIRLKTQSVDREDYILHPVSGEHLSDDSRVLIQRLREQGEQSDTQIVISEGLNTLAVRDGDQLISLVRQLRKELAGSGFRVAPTNVVVDAGRVRAGYRIGEQLFEGRKGRFTILHVIGERPGSGHHTLSIYMAVADGDVWSEPDKVDHNITKVVSGIAVTALTPDLAAIEAAKILRRV